MVKNFRLLNAFKNEVQQDFIVISDSYIILDFWYSVCYILIEKKQIEKKTLKKNS